MELCYGASGIGFFSSTSVVERRNHVPSNPRTSPEWSDWESLRYSIGIEPNFLFAPSNVVFHSHVRLTFVIVRMQISGARARLDKFETKFP